MERRALRRRAAAAASLLVVAAAAWWIISRPDGRDPHVPRREPPPLDARAPAGVRVRVEVLNATRVRGLARRATLHLRDRGFDVVHTGTAGELRDSTLVIDRSGNPEWARLVGRAMGGAAVESRPDSSRYLDVTVLVGASWSPPSEPLHP